MEKRNVILITAVAALVVLGYMWLNMWVRTNYPHWFEGPKPQEAAQTQPAGPPATSPATNPASPETGPTTSLAGPTTAPSLAAGLQVISSPDQWQNAAIGSLTPNNTEWPIHLSVTPLGAGLEQVILNGYPHAADYRKPEKDRRLYEFEQPYAEYPDTRPLATRWVDVNGTRVNTSWAAWTKEGPEQNTAGDYRFVTYSLTIGRPPATPGGEADPVVKMWYTFSIVIRSNADQAGLGFVV